MRILCPALGRVKMTSHCSNFLKGETSFFLTFRTFATEVLVIIGILYVCVLGQGSGPVASCQNISKFGQTDSCHTHVYYICRVTSATLEFVPTDQTSLKLCCKISNDSWVIPLHYSATRKRQFELVNIKVHKSGWLSLCFCDALPRSLYRHHPHDSQTWLRSTC